MKARDLNAEVHALIGIDMRQTLHRIREYSTKAGVQRAAVKLMRDTTKSVLGSCYHKLREAGLTQGDAKERAPTQDAYLDHLHEIRKAEETLAELEAERDAAQNALELGRSLLAYERTQLTYAGQT